MTFYDFPVFYMVVNPGNHFLCQERHSARKKRREIVKYKTIESMFLHQLYEYVHRKVCFFVGIGGVVL